MVLDEIVTYLAANVAGLTAATNLFYGPMKDEYPSAVVLVNKYGGMADEPNTGDTGTNSFGRATRLEYPRIQVLCRGVKDDFDGPDAQAEAVRTALMKIENSLLGSVRYQVVAPVQPPFFMRMDENFRNEIVCNYQVIKDKS